MEEILEVKDLSKHYDSFSLDKISFDIYRGYIMGYIGPNGAGKTTTIKAMLDIIKPDCGQVKIFGQELSKYPERIKQKIGFVIGENAYYEYLKAIDMAQIISRFYEEWDWTLFNKYMREFDLRPEQKIESYSKGMKIKFVLACAMSHNAQLFLLDEPTSGLDPVFRSELMEIFQSIISDGERSILFSTHITSDLDNIADYITFINQGRIVFSQDKDSIMENYGIIKGRKDQRQLVLETGKIHGIIDSNVGFSALTNQKGWFSQRYGNQLVVENADLEEIMVHVVRGKMQ